MLAGRISRGLDWNTARLGTERLGLTMFVVEAAAGDGQGST